MKRNLLSLLFWAFVCSCSPLVEPETPEDGSQDTTDQVDQEGKYACTLPETTVNGKTAWLPGDQILIHGEYSKDQVIRTLTASDISSDGKTCYVSVDGVTPYEQKVTKSKYYLAYPGELVNNESHCKDASRFKSTNALLMGGYNKGEVFYLSTIVGGFSFTVSGDYDSYEFKGNNDETIGYTTLSVRIAETAKIYSLAKGSELTSITGKVVADGTTMNHISMPGNFTLADGFLMTFYKGETPVKMLYLDSSFDIKRDEYVALGDVTSQLVDYKSPAANSHVSAIPTEGAVDLGAVETANCYVVTNPGVYSFRAVKGNSAETLSLIGSVEVLWETWGNAEEVTPNSVIAQVDFEKDIVYFRVAENFHPGNAVIAVRNDMGVIMWSWHIWVPKTPIESGLYNLSNYMTHDRNLGALEVASASGASPESIGLLYQWGRKDPFVAIGDFSTGKAATVAGQERTLFGGQMTTAKSIKDPTAFADFDGCWNPSSATDFWAEGKTMYDPCPPGYVVPYRTNNVLFTNSPSSFKGWDFAAANHVFSVGDPVTTYPLGGGLSWDGSYLYAGTGECVWSSRASSTVTNGYMFRLTSDGEKVSYSSSSRIKAYGNAVRCIAYDEIPYENLPGTPVQGGYKKYTANIEELSGLCLDPSGEFIWGVGDQGVLAKIGFTGSVEEVLKRSYDMEAVTIDPVTGDLYLGLEPDYVYKIAAPDYKASTSLFRVEDAKDYGNSGVEGIAWYKDNMLLVGAQTGANMWAYTLDGQVVWKKSLRTVAIGCQEIADIYYDSAKDQIWIIDSVTQCIYLLNGDATEHLATYYVSYGGNCESITVDKAHSCVWIADDGSPSELIKIDFTF